MKGTCCEVVNCFRIKPIAGFCDGDETSGSITSGNYFTVVMRRTEKYDVPGSYLRQAPSIQNTSLCSALGLSRP